MMQRSLPAIDITKYTASLCVVAIHTFTTSPIHHLGIFLFIQGIARLAVPFFFCCTGYFIEKKGIENSEAVFSYIKKILHLYIIWTLIYVPVEVIKMVGTNTLNLDNILNYIQVFLVQGSFVHLWYFPAIIVSVLTLHWLFSRVNVKIIAVLTSLLYIVGILGDGYSGVLQFLPNGFTSTMLFYKDFFQTTRNGIFFGIPFVFVGILISKYEYQILKLNHLKWLILSIVAVCFEVYMLKYFSIADDYNMTISMVPATIFLFCTLIKTPYQQKFNSRIFREHSILIYECHLLFYGIILAILSAFNTNILGNNALQFISVCVLSQLFSFSVVFLANNTNLRWLKAIY